MHFARVGIDVAVVEVEARRPAGRDQRHRPAGRRHHHRSAVTTPQWLGDDLTQIAVEKGGVIKPGRPVVLGRIDGEPGRS